MSSNTATALSVPASSATPARPATEIEEGDSTRVDRAMEQLAGLASLLHPQSGPPQATPPPPRLSVSVDDMGNYVVQDIMGVAYGVGRTPEGAVEDFRQALDDRIEFLRAHRAALHPRLQRQLVELERLFAGR